MRSSGRQCLKNSARIKIIIKIRRGTRVPAGKLILRRKKMQIKLSSLNTVKKKLKKYIGTN